MACSARRVHAACAYRCAYARVADGATGEGGSRGKPKPLVIRRAIARAHYARENRSKFIGGAYLFVVLDLSLQQDLGSLVELLAFDHLDGHEVSLVL